MDWKTCFQGKKILVVDDDSINRELMSDILTQMQCNVDFAKDGKEAIEKASKKSYDLFLWIYVCRIKMEYKLLKKLGH